MRNGGTNENPTLVKCKYLKKDTFQSIGKTFVIHNPSVLDMLHKNGFNTNKWVVSEYRTGHVVTKYPLKTKVEAKRAAVEKLTLIGKEKAIEAINSFQIINKEN